ncbi:MAG: O-methyltransferase [Bacteroidota bacterium]
MNWINPSAESYAELFTSEEDVVLKELRLLTESQHKEPHMLSGPVQGIFLQFISSLIRPQHVLEIGTMVGYSTICLAKGLAEGGKVHTIDKRKEDLEIARQFFKKVGLDHCIQTYEADALDLIPQLDYNWDLVFLDADKTGYISYYDMVVPLIRPGGLLIADNVLFHGAVLEENIKGKSAKAVHAFNEHVKNDKRVQKLMLTVRDGVYLIRKK